MWRALKRFSRNADASSERSWLEARGVNRTRGVRSTGLNLLVWVFWLGLVIFALLTVRYMFSADRRAEGLPVPPSVFENVGGLDDFPIGLTPLRDDVWILRSEGAISAIIEKPGCPYSAEETRLLDCHGRDLLVDRPTGPGSGDATGPFADMLSRLCLRIYPPNGDVWVYFEPWPGSMTRVKADGSLVLPEQGCPR
jgi:hypothetical protein